MKISLNWLREYVDIDMQPEELGRLLTMSGLELEGLEPSGQSLGGIVVARIISISPHPEADRLSLCQVDTGNGEVQVVCGAPNIFSGALAPFAGAGVSLPSGATISDSKIRGVRSQGMLLAEDEMGLTEDHTGVMILPPNLAPGTPFSSMSSDLKRFELADWVFDLSITPNRPDWTSVLGVAREIAALIGQRLRRPEIIIEEGGSHIAGLASVSIADPVGCPRYAAGVIQGVDIGPSPFWMRRRLFLSGIRSINNIVDVTNYVLLEMGQPLHAFDYNKLRENRIIVRRAEKGETFTTLDGETRPLNDESLMICDGERPVALAGIMGGLNSEITPETQDVLLESAFFDPVTIRRCSKRLGLSTEASYRFERGVDIEGATTALKRAMSLVYQLAGGSIASGIIDNYPRPYTPPDIRLRIDKINRLLGTSLTKDAVTGYMKALEMDVRDSGEDQLLISPPSFRVDITREADLIEEVARVFGYENIPVTYPSIRPGQVNDAPELALSDQIRQIMSGLGFAEIITYSFISPKSADMLGAEEESPLRKFVPILNPLAIDQSVMRTSLIPGILNTVAVNVAHYEKDLKLFEWGKVFFQMGEDLQPNEKLLLTAVITGLAQKKSWHCDDRAVDFYDIKGVLEALLAALGLKDVTFKREKDFNSYDPEVSAGVYCKGSALGRVGRVSSNVLEAHGLEKINAFLFELDIAALLKEIPETRRFQSIARFPAVYRDISLLLNRNIESAGVVDIIKEKGSDLIESVEIFDLYEDIKSDRPEKSLAFRISYRSKDRTLDGAEVNSLHETIIDEIKLKTGGRLREG
ncbi:Phenylalanine--tRNA ligase beta subunit [uncultured Desulfobacterium sp.]|uniref:Phenylalanine--tRNA ligase beta subunit n=1 Tax=uncultured Desulfobacterium sp. TaxID=201089 RepID=A0A445MZ59_9BACT|nr:Phenylalanine--tRNA ligase beta subunit [uncultured Desulfobacterium sp.]